MEKLLVENDKFWKDFDERKKPHSHFWTTDDEMVVFHTWPEDSMVTGFAYERVGDMEEDGEKAVFLLEDEDKIHKIFCY